MRVLQIVPRLPPPEEGVGSYALCLERALAVHGISTHFLTAEEGGLARRMEEAEADAVLLHYANYGYQRRGCPFWLPGALRRSRARRRVTIFHEVYATGPPWRSSFWTQPFQRRIAAAVARTSDALITSLDLYVRRIGPAASPEKTWVTPVFSTVGDPVGSGLVETLAHPGGNLTGLSGQAVEFKSKQLQLLLMFVPNHPSQPGEHDAAEVPEVVLTILRYARAAGCDYVLVEADADRIDALPTWDWR